MEENPLDHLPAAALTDGQLKDRINSGYYARVEPNGNFTLREVLRVTFKDGEPCENKTCRYHIKTPCEICGRINMTSKK